MIEETVEVNLYEELIKFFRFQQVDENYIASLRTNNFVSRSIGQPAIIQKVYLGMYAAGQIFHHTLTPPDDVRFALPTDGNAVEWFSIFKLILFPYMVNQRIIPVTYSLEPQNG